MQILIIYLKNNLIPKQSQCPKILDPHNHLLIVRGTLESIFPSFKTSFFVSNAFILRSLLDIAILLYVRYLEVGHLYWRGVGILHNIPSLMLSLLHSLHHFNLLLFHNDLFLCFLRWWDRASLIIIGLHEIINLQLNRFRLIIGQMRRHYLVCRLPIRKWLLFILHFFYYYYLYENRIKIFIKM